MPTATLEEIRTRTTEVRSQLEGLGEKLNGLRDATAEARDTNWLRDIRATTAELQAADAVHHAYTEMWDAEARAAIPTGAGPVGATGSTGAGLENRTAGEMFSGSDDVKDWLKRGGRGTSPQVEMERRTLISSGVTSGDGGILLPKGSPFLSPGGIDRRRLFVRDLIAPGSTTLSSVPYVRELTPRTTELAATAQVEGAAKAEAEMTFVAVDAPVRTIAAWVPVTNQVLEDAPTLKSYIDGRLAYMVMLAEENSMIAGPGTGSTITGILNTSGIQTQAFSSTLVATFGLAVGKIELVDGEADGVAINPSDFWTMITTRSANRFDGEATGSITPDAAPFGPPAMTIWGLPAVRTRSVPVGTPIVGAWRMGAQVFDRTTVHIMYSDNYSDYFVKNKSVVLAESRFAFAVHRPDYFVTVATS